MAAKVRGGLIVAHEVTADGYDRDALAMMARAAQRAMASGEIELIADRGYYKGEEIVACEQDGIAVTVSKPHTSNAAAHGRFDRADFRYQAEDNVYICPAAERLAYRFTSKPCTQTAIAFLGCCPADTVRNKLFCHKKWVCTTRALSLGTNFRRSSGSGLTDNQWLTLVWGTNFFVTRHGGEWWGNRS